MRLEVEVLDNVRVAEVQVDRAGVQLAERGVLVDVLHHAARPRLDDRVVHVRRGAYVDLARGVLDRRRDEPASVALLQRALLGERGHLRLEAVADSSPSSGARGSSYAAAFRCGPSTYGLSGRMRACSWERPKTKSGWRMRYWSSGSSRATRMLSAPSWVRPLRPACCQVLATLPG